MFTREQPELLRLLTGLRRGAVSGPIPRRGMIEHGNAHADGEPFGRWFIGDLSRWAQSRGISQCETSLRQSSEIEVKWGFHPSGEKRVEWAACSNRRTLSVLIRGRFLLRFRAPQDHHNITEIRLVAEGDYAIWDSETEHTWLVEEDAVILTVRWTEPSS